MEVEKMKKTQIYLSSVRKNIWEIVTMYYTLQLDFTNVLKSSTLIPKINSKMTAIQTQKTIWFFFEKNTFPFIYFTS